MTKFVLVLFVAIVAWFAAAEASAPPGLSCERFRESIDKVKSLIASENTRDSDLEKMHYVIDDNIFGAFPTYNTCSVASGINARLHTVAAQLFKNKYGLTPAEFEDLANKCHVFESYPATCLRSKASPPKYRPIDGRGNNMNNPEWGASDTPFARYQEKGYADGIYAIRKSVSGKDLPNARYLAKNVLAKGVRANPPPLAYGVFALLTVLFITHDVHYQTPVQPSSSQQEIQCCADDRINALPPYHSHPACFPISIPKDDECFASGNVGCINLVRSQQAEYTHKAQTGEIMNRATSYLDLSLIYGNHESELTPIRSYNGGQLRMGKNGVLPVDVSGEYLPSMRRFTMAPIASIWPSLFARNHNYLATRLCALNPQWNDETLFQEARRINIAIFQYNLITSKAVEAAISNIPINETYVPERNCATTLEFAIAYRMAHYYIHDEMLFQNEDGSEDRILQSDTIGRIDLLEQNYDAALKGTLAEVVNTGPYGDEITNRIGKKTKDGYGDDIIAIDIQRSRDQGLASYVDVRRKCNLKPEINCFDDLEKIMNKTNVKLLRDAYDFIEDIDYYVGGVFETYEILGNPLVGPTFGCVIANQWDNFAGGDIYYYSNPNSPHPFSPVQIKAVQNYSISSLICANTKINGTAKVWAYAPHPKVNPMTSCAEFPPIDLQPWVETIKSPNSSDSSSSSESSE